MAMQDARLCLDPRYYGELESVHECPLCLCTHSEVYFQFAYGACRKWKMLEATWQRLARQFQLVPEYLKGFSALT
jgi:hypothetical protein